MNTQIKTEIHHPINPQKLFTYKRWDVLIKYVYLKYLIKKLGFPNNSSSCQDYFKKVTDSDFQWFRNLYLNHLRILNGGFEEKTYFQTDTKETPEQFLEEFHQLWYDIAINDFNPEHPIPVNAFYQILNGAHRLSIGLVLKKDVPIEEHKNITQSTLEILPELFSDRLKYQKENPNIRVPRRKNNKNHLNQMSRIETDFLFLEYIKLRKKYLRFIICFRSQNYLEKRNQEFFEHFLTKKGYGVVNVSRIALTNYGTSNLINLLYYDEPKVNLVKKRELCYPKADLEEKLTKIYYTTLILIEHPKAKFKNLSSSGASDKMEIRNFLGGYDTIHISDNPDDTLRIGKLVYNQKSIEILNYSLPFRQEKLLERCFKFNKMLSEHKLIDNQNENLKIVSSSVLSLLGVRKANDLDYLILDNTKENKKNIQRNKLGLEKRQIFDKIKKRSHDSQMKYYPKSLFDNLFHPERCFYLLDFKFQTLPQLEKFKKKRCEVPKDINDQKLLETYKKIKHIIPELKVILFTQVKYDLLKNNKNENENKNEKLCLELLIKNKVEKIYRKYYQLQFFDNYLFIEIDSLEVMKEKFNQHFEPNLEEIKNNINQKYPNLKIHFLRENQDKWSQRILIHYLQVCQMVGDTNRWILFLNDCQTNNNQTNKQGKVFDLVNVWNHLIKPRVPNISYLELVEIPDDEPPSLDYLKKFFKNSHHIVDKNHMKNFFWKLIKKYYLEVKTQKINLFFQEILEVIFQKDKKALGDYKVNHEWKSFSYFY